MLAPHTVTTPSFRPALTVAESALSMGLLNVGARGSGKTTFLALIALQHLRKGRAQVIIDPLGTVSEALLHLLLRSLQHVPLEKHAAIWQKLRYIDVGNPDVVTPFPIYYRTGAETLREVAERFIDTLRLANPNLVKQASVTWPSLRRVGINTGMVLAALGFQLTEAEDLLFHTSEWEKKGLFDEAVKRDPEALPAVSYFKEQYLPLSRTAKHQLTSAFLDHVFTFALDPKLRLLFGATKPGINWEDVEQKGQTVILDFRHVADPETRRFAMLWLFLYLYEHIKARGRRHTTLGLIIDEFAELTQQVSDGVNPLAVRFDEFIQRYMRNHRIFFSCAFQSVKQIDEQLRTTLLSLGTYVFGKVATPEEARILADVLFKTDPFRVKHYRKVWGKDDPPPLTPGNSRYQEEYLWNMRQRNQAYPYYVLDYEPEHMPLTEQLELASQQLTDLGLFRFLCRPALREGEVSQDVIPISIESVVRDKATGEYLFPDHELVERVRSRLAARSGIPAATIRTEQEARLRHGISWGFGTAQGTAAGTQAAVHTPDPANGRQPATEHQQGSGDTGAHPEPTNGRETRSRPTLDAQQQAFLHFIVTNPDLPVNQVYKGVGIGVTQGTRIRDSLKAQGLVEELEVRAGSATGGRPIKCLIPTFAALELLGNEHPTGRGGALHRHDRQRGSTAPACAAGGCKGRTCQGVYR